MELGPRDMSPERLEPWETSHISSSMVGAVVCWMLDVGMEKNKRCRKATDGFPMIGCCAFGTPIGCGLPWNPRG